MYITCQNNTVLDIEPDELFQQSGICENATINDSMNREDEWPLERVVSLVVPFCFGLIGLVGLVGNGLVVVGEYSFLIQIPYLFIEARSSISIPFRMVMSSIPGMCT